MTQQTETMPADSPFSSWRPHHIGIRVPDFDAAVAWYEGNLGFRLVGRVTYGTTNFGMLALAGDDSFCLELLANPDGMQRPAYADLPGSHNLMGWHHISFSTPDLAASIDALKSKGIVMVSDPMDVPALSVRFAFFADPWGNLFELAQPLDP